VRTISLEGEKDVDNRNPKVLYFHIDGGAPDSAVLYLRGLAFSTLFYTELGQHQHGLEITDLSIDISHTHDLDGSLKTKAGQGEHRHSFYWDNGNPGAFDMNEADETKWVLKSETDTMTNPIASSGSHQHELEAIQLQPLTETLDVPVTGTVLDAGAADASVAARDGKPPLHTLADLVVKFDGTSITGLICDQLEAQAGQAGKWRVTGSGGAADVRLNGTTLSLDLGTGPIDLLKLGIDLGIGEHTLEFVVSDPDCGGKVQYNLYVS